MIRYKGFVIQPDKMQGFSLIDRNGKWCCSMIQVKSLKSIVDGIIKTDD